MFLRELELSGVLERMTVAGKKHQDQNNSGGKSLSQFTLPEQSIIEGSQSRTANRAGTRSQELM